MNHRMSHITRDLLTKKSRLRRCWALEFFKMRCYSARGRQCCSFSYNAITAHSRERAAGPGATARDAAVWNNFHGRAWFERFHVLSRRQRYTSAIRRSPPRLSFTPTFIVTRFHGVAHRAPQGRAVQSNSCQSSNDQIRRTLHAMTGIRMVPIVTVNPPPSLQPDPRSRCASCCGSWGSWLSRQSSAR